MSESPAEKYYHQPERTPQQDSAVPLVNSGTISEQLQEVVHRLWESVRHSADVIVTLRQENTILQSQLMSLRRSEEELQSRLKEFLERISLLEQDICRLEGAEQRTVGVDRVEDSTMLSKIHELESQLERTAMERAEVEAKLADAENQLENTRQQLREQENAVQSVEQLRSDLRHREAKIAEAHQEIASLRRRSEMDVQDTNDRMRIAQLEQQLREAQFIIEQYRSASLQKGDRGHRNDQLGLFVAEVLATPLHDRNSNIEAVALRLEEIADQLEQLAGLS